MLSYNGGGGELVLSEKWRFIHDYLNPKNRKSISSLSLLPNQVSNLKINVFGVLELRTSVKRGISKKKRGYRITHRTHRF